MPTIVPKEASCYSLRQRHGKTTSTNKPKARGASFAHALERLTKSRHCSMFCRFTAWNVVASVCTMNIRMCFLNPGTFSTKPGMSPSRHVCRASTANVHHTKRTVDSTQYTVSARQVGCYEPTYSHSTQ